jgi:hypothetical protein
LISASWLGSVVSFAVANAVARVLELRGEIRVGIMILFYGAAFEGGEALVNICQRYLDTF